jgi:hypothetical protein
MLVYGTSSFLNPAESLLVALGGKVMDVPALFFVYPRSSMWQEFDFCRIFYPESPPKEEEMEKFYESLGLKVSTIQDMLREIPEKDLTLNELVEKIKEKRSIKNFIVVWTSPDKKGRIYCSSKDRRWQEFSGYKLQDICLNKDFKLGGTLIYFIVAAYCREKNFQLLMPKRAFSDVLGAVWATGLPPEKIVECGNLDIITFNQQPYFQPTCVDGFRVAPPFKILNWWEDLEESERKKIIEDIFEKKDDILLVIGDK